MLTWACSCSWLGSLFQNVLQTQGSDSHTLDGLGYYAVVVVVQALLGFLSWSWLYSPGPGLYGDCVDKVLLYCNSVCVCV